MINPIEFVRVSTAENEYKDGLVHILAPHVVKIEAYERSSQQGVDTMLTLAAGHPEVVEGPPSEVIQRLRKGA